MPKATPSSRRPLLPLLLTLLAALAWFAWDRLGLAPIDSEPVTRLSQSGAGPQIYYGAPNSLAVLPFNCSRNNAGLVPEDGANPGLLHSEEKPPVNLPLAFGVAETLLDGLEQLPNLQLTAATSSFFFADSPAALLIVAERLKAGHLLDGCVVQDGDRLELQVRVFDAKINAIQWSEQFDIPLGEVIAVLDEVKRQVANVIIVEPGNAAPTEPQLNPDAWLRFLEGRFFYRQQDKENLEKAELAFKQVLEMQPTYAPAWLGLANIYLDPGWTGANTAEGFEQARQSAENALRLDPGLAGAHLALSRIKRIHDWDWRGAREDGQKALELQRGSADILANASTNEFTFGQFEKAISLLEESIRRNPLQLQNLLRLGLAYEFLGNYDQALITSRQLLGLNKDYPAVHAYRARVKLAQENPESALREADQEVSAFWKRYAQILALNALERHDEADALLADMILENGHDAAFQIAEIYAYNNEADSAFEWLEQAYTQRDSGLGGMIGNHFLAALETDPRWGQMLTRLGLE